MIGRDWHAEKEILSTMAAKNSKDLSVYTFCCTGSDAISISSDAEYLNPTPIEIIIELTGSPFSRVASGPGA
jgi:hypothetical protein